MLNPFDPPGHLDDLSVEDKTAWSTWISDSIDEAVAGYPDQFDFDGPRKQFYNPMRVETAPDAETASVTWTAFPKQVRSQTVGDLRRWRAADSSRDLQDEYCEWSVDRNDAGTITRVTFTCEGPEYWTFLASRSSNRALELYREFVSPDVKMEDLFTPLGRYRIRNRWNTSTSGGAMHLIQDNNTLHAEIELAGGASVVRKINNVILEGEQELIRCGAYGAAGRNSDPHIGAVVNSLTRQKADVALENPVGLYFGDLKTDGWLTPDGSDPKAYWTYVRGSKTHPLRAVYEVPAVKGFAVGDIEINGRKIQFGAQIADFITIKLNAVACRFGKSTVEPFTGCRRPKTGDTPTVISVSDFLAAPRHTR
jgi:hypothetical protein